MNYYFQGDFVISAASHESHTCPLHLKPLYDALITVLPEIPQIIAETPMRLWRGAYMEPGLTRIARAYTINKTRYVINLHIGKIEEDAMIEPHFHPFGDMAVFLVNGAYTNIVGREIDEQNHVVDPERILIEEGDAYVMSKSLCHDVEMQTGPAFSIMLHKKSNINAGNPDDYEKILPLNDQQKEEELITLTQKYFDTNIFSSLIGRSALMDKVAC